MVLHLYGMRTGITKNDNEKSPVGGFLVGGGYDV
jgi:hypothetical protein